MQYNLESVQSNLDIEGNNLKAEQTNLDIVEIK